MAAKGTGITMGGESSVKAGKSKQEKKPLSEDSAGALFGAFQAAVWTLGLAVLAWQGWWWPGIMVLVAISAISGPLFAVYLERRKESEKSTQTRVRVEAERAEALPHQCNACGAPLSATSVIWRSQTTASCPYCNSSIKATKPSVLASAR